MKCRDGGLPMTHQTNDDQGCSHKDSFVVSQLGSKTLASDDGHSVDVRA
jgi:hypothetical protein